MTSITAVRLMELLDYAVMGGGGESKLACNEKTCNGAHF